MVVYYVLWIPVREEGMLIPKGKPGQKRIQDSECFVPFTISGKIEQDTFDITFQYLMEGDTKTKTILLKCAEHDEHGFMVYSATLPDNNTNDVFLEAQKRKMLPAVYHYVKDFFHNHTNHDATEDALLNCFFSNTPVCLRHEKDMIANSYISQYDIKIENFLNDAKNDHDRCRHLVQEKMTTAKGVSMYSDLIRNGRNLMGEFEYCNFLLNKYANSTDAVFLKIQRNIEEIRRELESATFEYQLCTNTYSFRLGVIGIWVGAIGIVISTLGIVQSCNSKTDYEPILKQQDSLYKEQIKEILRLDSICHTKFLE